MPFVFVSPGAEEWIIARLHTRDILCQMNGKYSFTVSGLILVIISIDLFLFIVKAAHHHKIMTCKVTFGIVITI